MTLYTTQRHCPQSILIHQPQRRMISHLDGNSSEVSSVGLQKKTWGWNTAHINTTRENVGKKQHSRLLLVMLQRSAPKLGHASPANIFWGDIKGCKWGSRWSGSTPLAPKPPQKKGELKNPAKKWKWKWRYGCVPASKSWPSLAKSFFNNLGPATHTGFQSDTRPKKEPPTETSWTNCG